MHHLDKNICKNLKNNSESKKTIELLEVSEAERNECRRLINYLINVIVNQFDRETTFMRMSKTSIGYSFRLVTFY